MKKSKMGSKKSFGTSLQSQTSHSYYNMVWSEAQKEMRMLITEEAMLGSMESGDRQKIFDLLTDIYFKYMSMYRKLNEAYDQMVHPQKRILLKQILDLSILRIIEVRQVLVACECSEFFYFDEAAYNNNWTPDMLDMPVPLYYYHDRDPGVKEREGWLVELTTNIENEKNRIIKMTKDKADMEELERKLKADLVREDLDLEDAMIVIQSVERMRQGKLRYKMAKYISEEEGRIKLSKLKSEIDVDVQNTAAITIQKVVRGFIARKRTQSRRTMELQFLGLAWGSVKPESKMELTKTKSSKIHEQLEAALERRRTIRRRLHVNYENAKSTIENRIRLLEGPEMTEGLKSQLRGWLIDSKEKAGKFPDLPKTEYGDSKFMICPRKLSKDVLEKELEAMDPEYAKKKKKERKAEAAKKKKDKAKEKSKKKKGKKTDSQVIKLEPPVYLKEMTEANKEYNRQWRSRNETHNPEQKHEEQFIVHDKRRLVATEIRDQVDIVMKAELNLLKAALEKKKGKKSKKGKGKGKKGKGKGKGKKGKRKKGKDLTPDRSFQSLYEELVTQGIIRNYPKVRMDDLIGDYSLVNGTIRKRHANVLPDSKPEQNEGSSGDANPLPSLGDIKRALKDICIIPMGSQTIHSRGPFTKSLLIAGPSGVGKTLFVYAVCTELGATLFDLTAANMAGKYPGKPGLVMLMHLLNKVGRLSQPTIVLIDSCEKTYMKRVPKTDKTEPKRLKKQLGKFLKGIGPEDQVMLIGVSNEPWIAPFKLMKKDYQKVIYIPRPDHGTRLEMWRRELEVYPNDLHPDISFTLLAKLSDGWCYHSIKAVVTKAITAYQKIVSEETRRRRLRDEDTLANYEAGGVPVQIGRKYLRMDDLIEELAAQDPLFFEQDKAWTAWFNKTPLQKARLAFQLGIGGVKKKGKGKRKSKRR